MNNICIDVYLFFTLYPGPVTYQHCGPKVSIYLLKYKVC